MVGVVVLDVQGQFVVGIFIGGMINKCYGCVGDLLIVGVGIWVDVGCVVLGIGWGEYYIWIVVVYEICVCICYQWQMLEQVGRGVINEMILKMGGDGGVIVFVVDGKMVMLFNIQGMYWGWIGVDGVFYVVIFVSEILLVFG